MGGVSNEREVSFKSGKAVCEALRDRGHEVFPVDVSSRSVDELDGIAPDVAFIALHGQFGEDGEVQRLLELKGIPYTGSGPEASLRGMDKVATKRAFIRHAVPTASYLIVPRDSPRERMSLLGYPLVCKPACGGSSLGVSVVRTERALPAALDLAFEHGESASAENCALLERYIRGREFTVGVLDGEALPTVEICPKREFFDFQAKYSDEATDYIIPCALMESLYRRTQEAARQAYEAISCRHMARVDMIYGYDGVLYVLEVNTIPGFTPRSLLPMAADYVGVDFGELCERIAAMALRDARAQQAPRRRSA